MATSSAQVGTRKLLLVLLVAAMLCFAGCAATRGWDYAEEPGVPADVQLKDGGSLTGTLVELSNGVLVFDSSIDRGENVEVIRKDGTDFVYVDGVVTGRALEIRDYDIVARRSIPLRTVEELHVKARGYLGWGSAVAGVLTFFLVPILEDAR
jgi:hypothetical protein